MHKRLVVSRNKIKCILSISWLMFDSVESEWYRIMDDSEEDYLYPL